MDPPYGELHPHFIQSVLPRQHVLIDAVHERPVEIEYEGLHPIPSFRVLRRDPRSSADYDIRPKIVLGAPEPRRFRGPPITIHAPLVGIASRFVRFSSVKR